MSKDKDELDSIPTIDEIRSNMQEQLELSYRHPYMHKRILDEYYSWINSQPGICVPSRSALLHLGDEDKQTKLEYKKTVILWED